jgi:hypothetical protein
VGYASSSHGKFTKVVTDHLWFDVNLYEVLAVVDSDAASDKLRKNGHVSAVRSNRVGARAEHTVEEMFVFNRHTSAKTASHTRREKADDVVFFSSFRPHGHLSEFVHGETTVCELFLHTRRGG